MAKKKVTKKAVKKERDSSSGEKGLTKHLNEVNKRLAQALKKNASSGELAALMNERRDIERRLGLVDQPETTPEHEEPETDEAPVEESSSSALEDDGRWVLSCDISFGIVRENFQRGAVLEVDWDKGKFRCLDTGRTYDSCRDVEIAIALGKALPHGSPEAQRVLEESRQRLKNQRSTQLSAMSKQRQHDDDVRSRVINDDRDLFPDQNISHTKKKVEKPVINETPRDYTTLIKPRHRAPMPIIDSDGMQESRVVDNTQVAYEGLVVRPEVKTASSKVRGRVIANAKPGQTNWNASRSGEVLEKIKQAQYEHSIEIDDDGQQVIRGMPVIRDDSAAPSGCSLNAGQVVSVSPASQAKAENEKRRRRDEVSKKREKSGVVVEEPVVGASKRVQQAVEELPDTSKVKRLLKRRW